MAIWGSNGNGERQHLPLRSLRITSRLETADACRRPSPVRQVTITSTSASIAGLTGIYFLFSARPIVPCCSPITLPSDTLQQCLIWHVQPRIHAVRHHLYFAI